MKEIMGYTVFSLALLATMYVLFFTGNLAPVPGFGFILGSMAVLMWIVSFRLNRKWNSMTPTEKSMYSVLNELRWFFILGAVFFTIDLVPHVVLILAGSSIATVTAAHWTAHLLLFAYNVMGARIAMSFFNPRWKNQVTIIVALIGASALVASLMHPDYFVTIPGSEYPLLSSDRTYALFNMISNITSAGAFGLYLVYKGLTESNSAVRARAVLMGLGLLCTVPAGYIIHFVHSPYNPILIYTAFTGWALLTGISALLTIRKPIAISPSA